MEECYSRNKHCCRNCLREKFEIALARRRRVCSIDRPEFNEYTDKYCCCELFVKRSVAYQLRAGKSITTPNGKTIHSLPQP